MTDQDFHDRLHEAEKDLARIQRDIDEQLKFVHRLEAQGHDDANAQQKLEALLEALETAQQRYKAIRGSG